MKESEKASLGLAPVDELTVFKSILKHLPCSIYWEDKEGTFLGCSDYMAKLSGLESATDVIGKNSHDMVWSSQQPILRATDEGVMLTNQQTQTEETVMIASGETRTYLSLKAPLRDQHNSVIGIFGVSLDITEQKKLEEHYKKEQELALKRAKKAEATLENIIRHLPDHVYWKDAEGVYLGCNKIMADSLGLRDPKDIIGKTDYDLSWKDIAKDIAAADLNVMQSGQLISYEENGLVSDGSRKYVLSNKLPLKDHDGSVIGTIGISTDVTTLKKTQEALELSKNKAEAANLAKSEFLANMSHELRTPLNGILGMAQLLGLSKNLDEEDRSKVDDLVSSGNILLELINDVLNFARAESGKIAMQAVPIQLPELVGKTIKSLSPLAIEKNLMLTSEMTHQCPAIIISDPLRIRQILTNLIGNALKFTEKGRVNIAVDVTEQEGENITLQFSVEDTGCGIPEDQLEPIFERFHQVNSSYKTTKVGTGLGLALVKKLVGELKGTVGVHSNVNAGSTFYFSIPCKVQITQDSSAPSQKLMEALKKKNPPQQARG